jgi:response regulator of citrate/malate metabolism
VTDFECVGQALTLAGALKDIHALRPDLLLLDIYLPDGSGLELLRTLTGESARSRPDAIVITAARDLALVREAMKMGVVGYLVKPFGFPALAERLMAYRQLCTATDPDSLSQEADQNAVDALFMTTRPVVVPTLPPKGHSASTLARVREAVRNADTALTATGIAAEIGISRSTAQRYLQYLVNLGEVGLNLRYGTAGRPEHQYRPVE